MKVYFLWDSTKLSLDQLFAALAFSMPRYLVLPPSQHCVRSLVDTLSAGLLSPCQGPCCRLSLNHLFGGLAVSMPGSNRRDAVCQDWINCFVGLPRSDRRPTTYETSTKQGWGNCCFAGLACLHAAVQDWARCFVGLWQKLGHLFVVLSPSRSNSR